jgi:UDP-glucose-4-epimerase GalE
MMRILVTGGAGYVGSACLRFAIDAGHEAVAFDNLVEGHPDAVGEASVVEGDIADTPLLIQTIRDHSIDAVMHFAAATNVGESVENPGYHYGNNIGGTLSLLRAMKETGVDRMLFSSTCATYGMSPVCPMSEDTPQEPFSPYARTKLTVEWMIRDFAHAHGLGFTLLRYFNASGASPDGKFGEYHNPETHLIPIALQVPLGERDKLFVFGNDYETEDGTCIRDYVHIDDLASAHLLAIGNTNPTTAEVFNIGTGNGCSVLEIIEACKSVTGHEIPFEIVDRRPGDPPALVADPKKIMDQLGWKPKYLKIEDTIETAWCWHREHPGGYERRQK